ncbi:hypothetical protein LXL04_038775 [Taraxacum kok-saghyz]
MLSTNVSFLIFRDSCTTSFQKRHIIQNNVNPEANRREKNEVDAEKRRPTGITIALGKKSSRKRKEKEEEEYTGRKRIMNYKEAFNESGGCLQGACGSCPSSVTTMKPPHGEYP